MENAPFSEGPLDARICIIGEAPGATEEQLRRPFVGQAGKLLDQLLVRAGIPRASCRIENVLQFRPRNNDISEHIDLSKTVPLLTKEGRESIAALKERLKESKANVFVPLGNVPLFALTGLKDITKRRGSILPSYDGRKVIPTIHPASALRMYIQTHFISFDLTRVRKESAFPEIKLLERNLRIDPSFDDCISYIRWCREHENEVGFDIEVSNNNMSHASLALSATDAICIPFYEAGNHYFTPQQEALVMRELALFLESENVAKVGQNITFDATMMLSLYGIATRPIEDTMIGMAILYPDFPKGLDFITSIYCEGEPYYKDDGKRWFKNPFGDFSKFRRYSAMDSAVCIEAFPKLMRDLKKQGNYEAYKRQLRIVEPLVYISVKGIKVDVDGMKKAAFETTQQIDEKTKELHKICGLALNINSPKQVRDYLYISKGIKPVTKNGVPTVDVKALMKLSGKGVKEASLILELRKLHKIRGTYYEMNIDSDGRLRCSFNPVGTTTGRISSSKTIFGTGGNMQNQPPEMKRLMQADPGYIFIERDLSQAENRVVAIIANEPKMRYAFDSGQDVHRLTAGLIFKKPPEEISDEPGSSTIGGGEFSERFWGKKANHGLNYDLGYMSFAMLYQISNTEAKFIVERYHQNYPGIRQWHAGIRAQLSTNRRLTNCLGRIRVFNDRWGDDMFKEAYAFVPQSSVGEILNAYGLCGVYYNKTLRMPDKTDQKLTLCTFNEEELLNQVHDSIVTQFPLDKGPELLYSHLIQVLHMMETPIKWQHETFTIPVDTAIGFTLDKKKMLHFSSKELHNLPREEVIEKLRGFIDGNATTS